jgi:translation initiation factor 2 subunit 1
MRQTAAWLEEDLEKLYERVGWPLSRQFSSLYDAFMISLNEPEQVFSKIEIDDKTKELLMDNISKRMKPVNSKISSTFELTCYTFEGIDAIQKALKESLAKIEEDEKESEEEKIKINLIKSPLYECYTHRNVKIQEGIDKITTLLKYIEDSITESKGKFFLSRLNFIQFLIFSV